MNIKSFLLYWLIVLSLTGAFIVGGWYVVDRYELISFTKYSLIGLPIIGLIRYVIFEFVWRKL